MWINHKFFKYAAGTLLVLLIIFMFGKIGYFLAPFGKLFSTIIAPLFVACLFYYILRPLVRLLEKLRLPRTLAIITTFIAVVLVFILLSMYTGSIIVSQFNQLLNDLPGVYEAVRQRTADIMDYSLFDRIPMESLEQKAVTFVEKATQSISSVIFGIVSAVTNISTILFIVPFILFYFLKDDRGFAKGLLSFVPRKYKANCKIILKDIDGALSSYILGQMIVALAIGLMMFIGYLIIHVKYPAVLALFAMMTCIIPFFGPWIGIIPALLIGITSQPFMAVKVLIVMLVVQQIDNNLISPFVMGKRLDIHPVTVILVLMAGVSLMGFVGLIIAIPAYAALKVTFRNIYQMYISKHMEIEGMEQQ